MKRRIALILALCMMVVFSACGKQMEPDGEQQPAKPEVNSEQEVQKQEDAQPQISAETIEQKEEEFIANTDISVVAGFVYDRDTYIVVENVGEQPVLNLSVAYLNFDKNGFLSTNDSKGYESGRAETVNLMPGEKDILAWYGATGEYAVATITKVDYADGTSWEAEHINLWVEAVKSSFSIDSYKEQLEEIKETAALAESNEYAELTGFYTNHGNRFSNDLDLHFSISNTCEQGITQLNIYVLEFDENGFPVSVSPYDTYCINGHRTGGKVNLAAGKSGEYSDDLFIDGNTTNLKVVIAYMEFQDGTEWFNPYIYEWIIANHTAY